MGNCGICLEEPGDSSHFCVGRESHIVEDVLELRFRSIGYFSSELLNRNLLSEKQPLCREVRTVIAKKEFELFFTLYECQVPTKILARTLLNGLQPCFPITLCRITFCKEK